GRENGDGMERVTRTRFTDEAYRHLRAAITSGELPEGAQLRGEELAQQLGLSRTPVREALLRLEADRLVEVRRGRAATVRIIGVKEALDAIDVFWTLTRRAYALAVPRLTEEELASVEASIDEAERIAARPGGRAVDALDVLADAQDVLIRASGNDE